VIIRKKEILTIEYGINIPHISATGNKKKTDTKYSKKAWQKKLTGQRKI
jgi:hypothetical protein